MTTRREVLIGLGALAALPACGNGGTMTMMDTGGGSTTCGAIVDDNHGHTLTIPRADAEAGTARSYTIQGASPHSHTVNVSPAQFAVLADVGSVIVTTTLDAGHMHQVTINCG